MKGTMQKMDDQDDRIASIFDTDEVPEVSDEILKTYLQYIKDNLDTTCEITGIEDFDWEEYYIVVSGSKKEHKKLLKSRPSHMDLMKGNLVNIVKDVKIRDAKPSDHYNVLSVMSEWWGGRDLSSSVLKDFFNAPLYGDYPELISLDKRMIKEENETGYYTFLIRGTDKVVKNEAAWQTIQFFNNDWIVVAFKEIK
jgi:hypothetical protein